MTVTTIYSDGSYELSYDDQALKLTITNGGKSDSTGIPAYPMLLDEVPRDYPLYKTMQGMGVDPSEYFVFLGRPIRNAARSAIDAMVEDVKSRVLGQNEEKAAALLAAVPGLDRLRDALADEDRYERAFQRMMEDENNDGARPPEPAAVFYADLAREFPRATLYLKAEAYSFAAHHAKFAAGKRAMELLAAGGSETEAKEILDNWLPESAKWD